MKNRIYLLASSLISLLLIMSSCSNSRPVTQGGYEYDDIYFSSADHSISDKDLQAESGDGDYYDPNARQVPREELSRGQSRGNFNNPGIYNRGHRGISPYTSMGMGIGYSRFNRGFMPGMGMGMGFGDPFMRHGMMRGGSFYGYDPFMSPYRRSGFGMNITYGNPYGIGMMSPYGYGMSPYGIYDPFMMGAGMYGGMRGYPYGINPFSYGGVYNQGGYAGGNIGSNYNQPRRTASALPRNQVSTRPSYSNRTSRDVAGARSKTVTSGTRASASPSRSANTGRSASTSAGKRATSRPDFSSARSASRAGSARTTRSRTNADRTANASRNYTPYSNTRQNTTRSSTGSRSVTPSRSYSRTRSAARTAPQRSATQNRSASPSRRSYSPSRTRSTNRSASPSRSGSYSPSRSSGSRSYSPSRSGSRSYSPSRSSGSRSFSRPSRSSTRSSGRRR